MSSFVLASERLWKSSISLLTMLLNQLTLTRKDYLQTMILKNYWTSLAKTFRPPNLLRKSNCWSTFMTAKMLQDHLIEEYHTGPSLSSWLLNINICHHPLCIMLRALSQSSNRSNSDKKEYQLKINFLIQTINDCYIFSWYYSAKLKDLWLVALDTSKSEAIKFIMKQSSLWDIYIFNSINATNNIRST